MPPQYQRFQAFGGTPGDPANRFAVGVSLRSNAKRGIVFGLDAAAWVRIRDVP